MANMDNVLACNEPIEHTTLSVKAECPVQPMQSFSLPINTKECIHKIEVLLEPKAFEHTPEPDAKSRSSLRNLKKKFLTYFTENKSKNVSDDLQTEVQLLLKYCKPALERGRPLDRVMIMMAGQSGAGKSDTVNALFEDKVCCTARGQSTTVDVTEYGKNLCVTSENSLPIEGYLSIVDVPGAVDTDESRDAVNLSAIIKFRETHVALTCREDVDEDIKIRQSVYPNLVLMAIKADDNRMLGKDSAFQKTLEILKSCYIVDPEVNNLLVVATHAVAQSPVPFYYKKESEYLTETIQTIVKDTIGIRDVRVVFVENKPKKFGLVKGKNSDFYELPDGELSHYNLFKAIVEHFAQKDDELGKLFCSWYFVESCPDKKKKTEIMTTVAQSSVSKQEIKEAQDRLGKRMVRRDKDGQETRPLQFKFIGRGFDPKIESTKDITAILNDSDPMEVCNQNYTVPSGLKVSKVIERIFTQFNYKTQKEYEESMHKIYGLDSDIRLVVKVPSKGRWVTNEVETEYNSVVTVLREIRLANMWVDDPGKYIKEELKNAFGDLKTPYNRDTAYGYNEFFSKWGTHFISSVHVGGYIEVSCSVDASTYNREADEIISSIKKAMVGELASGVGGSHTTSQREHFQDQTVVISGGNPPDIRLMSELTTDQLNEWEESLNNNPSELKHHVKLYPYYNMTEGALTTSLRDATIDYLNGNLEKFLSRRRDGFANTIMTWLTWPRVWRWVPSVSSDSQCIII